MIRRNSDIIAVLLVAFAILFGGVLSDRFDSRAVERTRLVVYK